MSKEQTDLESDEDDKGQSLELSRRHALATVGGLGLLTFSVDSAKAAGTTLELGGSYDASGFNFGLKIEGGSGTDQAFAGINNKKHGIGFLGKARGDGFTKGVEGQAVSPEGKGVLGKAASKSGSNKGVEGQTESSDGKGIFGVALNDSGSTFGVEGQSYSPSGIGVQGYARASKGNTFGVRGKVDSPNGYGIYTPDDAKVDGKMEVGNDLEVTGVKNFVQTVTTDTGPKQVKYTSIEAGEPQTETSDVAEMEDGVAVVELPDHFGMVTSSEKPVIVQITPYCNEKVHPQVTDRSTKRIVVKDFAEGSSEYTFAYTVKGIRYGFEDQNVVTEL